MKETTNENQMHINYNEIDTHGIIYHLKRKGSNYPIPYPSDTEGSDPYNLFDDNPLSGWHTGNIEDASIIFDFGEENMFSPSGYILKSAPWGWSQRFPQSWILEGSIDRVKWFTLDEQNNSLSLNGFSLTAYYPVVSNNSFRFFQLKRTGPNLLGDNKFELAQVEFFGYLNQ